jgi:hypothetical protein
MLLERTITLRVRHRSIVDLDVYVCTKVLKLHHRELSPIINDNIVGYAKLINNLSDEFLCLGRYNGGGKLYFDPFYEFIHNYEDMCESIFVFLERTYQIQPPY